MGWPGNKEGQVSWDGPDTEGSLMDVDVDERGCEGAEGVSGTPDTEVCGNWCGLVLNEFGMLTGLSLRVGFECGRAR